MIPLRLLAPWNGYDPGEVRLPDGYEGVAEELVRQGLAEHTAPAAPPTPRAARPGPKKGKDRGTGTVHA